MFAPKHLVEARHEMNRAQRALRHLRARLGSTRLRALDPDLLDTIDETATRVAAAREAVRKIDPTFTG